MRFSVPFLFFLLTVFHSLSFILFSFVSSCGSFPLSLSPAGPPARLLLVHVCNYIAPVQSGLPPSQRMKRLVNTRILPSLLLYAWLKTEFLRHYETLRCVETFAWLLPPQYVCRLYLFRLQQKTWNIHVPPFSPLSPFVNQLFCRKGSSDVHVTPPKVYAEGKVEDALGEMGMKTFEIH